MIEEALYTDEDGVDYTETEWLMKNYIEERRQKASEMLMNNPALLERLKNRGNSAGGAMEILKSLDFDNTDGLKII